MKWSKYSFHPVSNFYTMQIHLQVYKISWNKNIVNLQIIKRSNEYKLMLKHVPIRNEENIINIQKKPYNKSYKNAQKT